MTSLRRDAPTLLALSLLAGWSCSSSTSSQGAGGSAGTSGGVTGGGAGGTAGTLGGSAGSAAGIAGGSTGGTAGVGGKAGVGGTAGVGGMAGESAGTSNAGKAGSSAGRAGSAAGSSGAGGFDGSKTCDTVDDCVIANFFTSTGCCTRTDCGVGFNREWVENEPCASADPASDPVPASCSMGCLLCPASVCPVPLDVACHRGSCAAITEEGPCTTDEDCVLGVDYSTIFSGCCGCPSVFSKAFVDTAECTVLSGTPPPVGCVPLDGECAAISCIECVEPTPKCTMGRCSPG